MPNKRIYLKGPTTMELHLLERRLGVFVGRGYEGYDFLNFIYHLPIFDEDGVYVGDVVIEGVTFTIETLEAKIMEMFRTETWKADYLTRGGRKHAGKQIRECFPDLNFCNRSTRKGGVIRWLVCYHCTSEEKERLIQWFGGE